MRPVWKKLLKADFYAKIFLFPLFGGVTTISGIIAGYLGTHYDVEIAQSFHLVGWSCGKFDAHATFFWLVTIFFGVCFTGTFWAQARSNLESTQSLQQAVNQLYTLPPVGFLEIFRQTSIRSSELFLGASDGIGQDGIALAIRGELSLILVLANSFYTETDNENAEYGCNIMLFVDGSGAKAAERNIQNKLKFIEPGVSVANLQGALELRKELSVMLGRSNKSSDPDNNLTDIALPVPKPTDGTYPRRNLEGILPGAPYSFVTDKPLVLENVDTLLAQVPLRQFTDNVRNELTKYFQGNQEHVQSIMCIPLHKAGQPQPIGVLNIHKNLPIKLALKKFELFAPLLTPTIIAIENLLLKYE